jgi:hypothetical protein
MASTSIVDGSVPVVRFALFADGYYEGEPSAVEVFLATRSVEEEDLRYWVAVLERLPADGDAEVRRYLEACLVERVDAKWSGSNLASELRGLVAGNVSRPQGWIRTAVQDAHRRAVARLAVLQKPLTRPPEGLGPAVVSVGVTAERVDSRLSFGVVENVSTEAIEAFVIRGRTGSNVSSTLASDWCGLSDQRSDVRPVRAGETREVLLGPQSGTFELAAIVFENREWEGASDAYGELIAMRKRRVANRAFWAAALKEAALLSPDQARDHLLAKHREHAALPAISREQGEDTNIEGIISRTRTAPWEFPSAALALATWLEHLRAACR